MKKLMLMSALASAILITTATTSCKKGDQGPAGANGVGKDGKDGAITVGMAQIALRSSVKEYTEDAGYTAATGIASISKTCIDNAANLKTVAERHAEVEKAKKAITENEKKEKLKSITNEEAALAILEQYMESHSTIAKPSNALKIETYAQNVKAALVHLNSAFTVGTKILVSVEKIESVSSAMDLLIASTDLKDLATVALAKAKLKTKTDNLAKLQVVADETVKTAFIKKATDLTVTDANGVVLVCPYDNGSEASCTYANGDAGTVVTTLQKESAIKAVISRNALVSAIKDLEKLSPNDSAFATYGVDAKLRKELGLAEAPVVPAKK